ncbi:MAG: hypothetical protein FWE34_06375 [Defluviitaleaceae bacterium]|nr:hypothetical protein [Defluviitaleaceae bacterium]
MNINELIEQGYNVKNTLYRESSHSSEGFISGEEYEKWIQLSIRYLRQNHIGEDCYWRFKQAGENANGNGVKHFHTMIGILEALSKIPLIQTPKSDTDIEWIINKICTNFNKCAKTILNRRKDKGVPRETIKIQDEYDVQDLLHGVLRLFVNDVRPEDYVPSCAGSNSRVDFYLPEHEMYIETKMTRDGLDDKKIGDELSVDITHYNGKCKVLICFIYDGDGHLKNPYGLINDLESLKVDGLEVKVYISPL